MSRDSGFYANLEQDCDQQHYYEVCELHERNLHIVTVSLFLVLCHFFSFVYLNFYSALLNFFYCRHVS